MTNAAALLEVQRLDNSLDQLRYKHEHLPERAALAEIADEERALHGARDRTLAHRDELRRQQKSFEDDASDVERKRKELEGRLYDGSITSPKDATALGEEIEALKDRQSGLEDQSIELLVDIEPLDDQLVQAEAAQGHLDARRAELETSFEANTGELDAEIASTETERVAAASEVPPELLEQYGKLRITYGPDAIVEFDAGRGGGCPVAMSAVELDRWKHLPAGTVENCVDCGRLVIKLD